MSGLGIPPSPLPEVVSELKRGAVLGLLRLEIETIILRLEIESLWRQPEVELFESRNGPWDRSRNRDRDEEPWIVRVNPAVWGSRHAGGSQPSRRVFRLRAGRAALRSKPALANDPGVLLAMARELVALLETEYATGSQDAA